MYSAMAHCYFVKDKIRKLLVSLEKHRLPRTGHFCFVCVTSMDKTDSMYFFLVSVSVSVSVL